MPQSRFSLITILMILSCLLSTNAFAKPEFAEVVMQAGLMKTGGKIASAGCNLCHLGAPPKLNPYGLQLKPLVDATPEKKLTEAILKQVAEKDADGDGATNAYEFEQDTLPGDATSKPKIIPVVVKSVVSVKTVQPSERNALVKLVLPRHAQHPVLVHFPLALFVIGFLFDLFGSKKRNPAMLEAGYLNLWIATLFSPFTVVTGLLAWHFNYGGISIAALTQNLNLLVHLLMGVSSSLLMFAALRTRGRLRGRETLPSAYLGLALFIFICVVVTGHLGGTLVYPE